MGIETSGANRKGKEYRELDKEKNPILNPYPSPKANTNTRGKKGRRGGQLKKSAAVTPVQKLYDTCKDVFSVTGPGIVPSPDQIEKLRAVLDGIKPEDVGLSSEMAYFRSPAAGRTPAIRYLHLHECDKFSIGIFCFPPSGVIPLHNHPGMTVFSKLLFGEMHIKSYDWAVENTCNDSAAADPSEVEQPENLQTEMKQPEGLQFEMKQRDAQGPKMKQSEVEETESKQPDLQEQETEQPYAEEPKMKQSEDQQPEAKEPNLHQPKVKQPLVEQPPVRLAKVKINSDFTAPCNPTILYPADGGNMHRFTAITACAVLDVLGPPYSDPDGRHCTYYYDFPFTRFSVDGVSLAEEEKESYAWLLEKGMQPEEFAIVGELYRGPRIVKS